jgi:hypothetical protein
MILHTPEASFILNSLTTWPYGMHRTGPRQAKRLPMLQQPKQVPGFQSRFLSKRRALDFSMEPNQRFVFGLHLTDRMYVRSDILSSAWQGQRSSIKFGWACNHARDLFERPSLSMRALRKRGAVQQVAEADPSGASLDRRQADCRGSLRDGDSAGQPSSMLCGK